MALPFFILSRMPHYALNGSTTGLARRPGTAVLPTCSMMASLPVNTAARTLRSSSNRRGQSGSYGTMVTRVVIDLRSLVPTVMSDRHASRSNCFE